MKGETIAGILAVCVVGAGAYYIARQKAKAKAEGLVSAAELEAAKEEAKPVSQVPSVAPGESPKTIQVTEAPTPFTVELKTPEIAMQLAAQAAEAKAAAEAAKESLAMAASNWVEFQDQYFAQTVAEGEKLKPKTFQGWSWTYHGVQWSWDTAKAAYVNPMRSEPAGWSNAVYNAYVAQFGRSPIISTEEALAVARATVSPTVSLWVPGAGVMEVPTSAVQTVEQVAAIQATAAKEVQVQFAQAQRLAEWEAMTLEERKRVWALASDAMKQQLIGYGIKPPE